MRAAAIAALLLAGVVSGLGPVFVIPLLALGWALVSGFTREPEMIPASAPGASRGAYLALALLVLGTLVLRWPIASHDVEHYVGPDEGEVVENVLEMIRMGDLDHRHRGYPGLHFYLQMLPARARVAWTGKSIPELSRAGFYEDARRLTLVAGVLTVALVFAVGRRLAGPAGAFLACALVASSPLSFRESSFVSPDLLLGLAVTAALWASLRLLERRSVSSFLVAGGAVGVASAIKYTGAFAVAPYALAWWLARSPDGADRRRALAGLLFGGTLFVVSSPYTLLNLPGFFDGLAMHVGYYRADEMNASWELSRQLAFRGVGIAAALAAAAAAFSGLFRFERRALVVLAFPLVYLYVFAWFDRAYPRHALVLVPHAALLAAAAVRSVTKLAKEKLRPAAGLALSVVVLASPVVGSLRIARQLREASPAEQAALWVQSNLPPGSRVLQDQFTPRLDPALYRVDRLGVEERRFLGNYDYVLYSGYPPGIDPGGLREVARFAPPESLGAAITLYEAPERSMLMSVDLDESRGERDIGAGELAHFGDGWYPPAPGAFSTSRLSRGERSEIFFVLGAPAGAVELELVASAAEGSVTVSVEANGSSLSSFRVGSAEDVPEAHRMELAEAATTPGLNRVVLRYDELVRLNRRRRDTALRLYRLKLRWSRVPEP